MDSSSLNHCLPTSGITFIMKIRFRILAAFDDKKRSDWDLQNNEGTGKAEEIYTLSKISCYLIMNMLHTSLSYQLMVADISMQFFCGHMQL